MDHIRTWLDPLAKAAADRDDINVLDLMAQAAGNPNPNPLHPQGDLYGVRNDSMDWIRYGNLLREALGWHHYPTQPANPN